MSQSPGEDADFGKFFFAVWTYGDRYLLLCGGWGGWVQFFSFVFFKKRVF